MITEKINERLSKLTEFELQNLAYFLMKDLRGNWTNSFLRNEYLKEIATILSLSALYKKCLDFEMAQYDDGRRFRADFKFGGYEDFPYEIIQSLQDERISKNFLLLFMFLITYPEQHIRVYSEV